MPKRTAAGAVVGALALALAACGGGGGSAADGKLKIATSFYPLQYAAQRIAGDRATVTDLTQPGAEPHDLELSPRQVADVDDADLVVYLGGGGFQPAVDDAVEDTGKDNALDVEGPARLTRTLAPDQTEEPVGDGAQRDPHFWLDPVRFEAVGAALARRLAKDDPAGAAVYQANEKAFAHDLQELGEEFRQGLRSCRNKDLVTSHSAFGYLAARYGLIQLGITGLTPDAEPDAADLARTADFVRAHDVRTIYHETLVSPAIARTVASETGARTAVLDPLEGLTTASAGTDYLSVMRANLASLKKGQPCP